MMTSPHHMQLTQPAVLSRLLERLLGQIGSVVVGKPVGVTSEP